MLIYPSLSVSLSSFLSSHYSNRFFPRGGDDEKRVRMNVTPAERRGFRAKTTSRNSSLSRGSSSCLCSLLLPRVPLVSLSLSLSFSRLCPRLCIPWAMVHLTRDAVLYVARYEARLVRSRVVSLSVLHKRNDADGYLPLHVAPAWSTRSYTEKKKKSEESQSTRYIVCASSGRRIVRVVAAPSLAQVTLPRIFLHANCD